MPTLGVLTSLLVPAVGALALFAGIRSWSGVRTGRFLLVSLLAWIDLVLLWILAGDAWFAIWGVGSGAILVTGSHACRQGPSRAACTVAGVGGILFLAFLATTLLGTEGGERYLESLDRGREQWVLVPLAFAALSAVLALLLAILGSRSGRLPQVLRWTLRSTFLGFLVAGALAIADRERGPWSSPLILELVGLLWGWAFGISAFALLALGPAAWLEARLEPRRLTEEEAAVFD
jgi:hypothetical protein